MLVWRTSRAHKNTSVGSKVNLSLESLALRNAPSSLASPSTDSHDSDAPVAAHRSVLEDDLTVDVQTKSKSAEARQASQDLTPKKHPTSDGDGAVHAPTLKTGGSTASSTGGTTSTGNPTPILAPGGDKTGKGAAATTQPHTQTHTTPSKGTEKGTEKNSTTSKETTVMHAMMEPGGTSEGEVTTGGGGGGGGTGMGGGSYGSGGNVTPQVENFQGIEEGQGLFDFTGQVVYSPGAAGLTVNLGGIPDLENVNVTTNENGNFGICVQLQTNGNDNGTATAQTTVNGIESNVACYYVLV